MHNTPQTRRREPEAPANSCTFSPTPTRLPSPVLTIPVLPYVARYLETVYPQGYKLGENDAVGHFISQHLRYPKHRTQYDQYLVRYRSSFLVTLPAGKPNRKYYGAVNSFLAVRFSDFMEAVIRQRMYDFVDAAVEHQAMKKAAAIRQFCTRYAISENDLAYETLLKAYQRHCWRRAKITSGK